MTQSPPATAGEVSMADLPNFMRAGSGSVVLDEALRARLRDSIRSYDLGRDTDEPAHHDGSLYASPAATQALLDDGHMDLPEWLLREALDPLAAQAGQQARSEDFDIGPVKLLRDPYSAKPYVLFYLTTEVLPTGGDQ